MSEQDDVNRATWSKPASRHVLDRRRGFLPGEREPFNYVSDHLSGRPVLELGVGMGRTIPFTSTLTSDYRALDYLPEMVAACHTRFPGVRVDLGDARTLDGLPDHHFGLVTFAWNGIDAVSHVDRARVLTAVRRVLAPDGMFFFSTLNLDGPDLRERPWHIAIEPTRNPVVMGVRAARAARFVAQYMMNWVRLLPLTERGPGYAVAPLGAHEFSILAHYTTLGRQLDELDEAGFSRDVLAFASVTGTRIYPGDDTHDVSYFHVVATPRT